MLVKLIKEHFRFSFILAKHFARDLLLLRDGQSLITYWLLASVVGLYTFQHLILRVISGGIFIITAVDTVHEILTLHRMFFCCGMDIS